MNRTIGFAVAKGAYAPATAFVAMSIFLMAGTPAFAEPTNLLCNIDAANPFYEDEPSTVQLDEAQHTVTVHISANHLKNPDGVSGGADGRGGNQPVLIGPLPAQFGADTITFSNPGPGYTGDYAINRLTGSLVNTSINWRWSCHAAQKQF